MKSKVHLQKKSEVLTREDCGGTIDFGITGDALHIFYGLIVLLQGLFYSLPTSFSEKEKS